MRQLDPISNLVLAALAGMGLLGTLSMPWFVPPASSTTKTDGPVEKAAWQVSHFFGTNVQGGVDGSEAIGSGGKSALLLVVGAVIVLAALVAVPSVRKPAEDMLRVAGFVAPVAVIVLAFTHSGIDRPVHIHYGWLVSFAAASFMASCAFWGASMRARRKQTPRAIRVTNS